MIGRNRIWGPRKRRVLTALSVAAGLVPLPGAQSALAAPAVEVCGQGAGRRQAQQRHRDLRGRRRDREELVLDELDQYQGHGDRAGHLADRRHHPRDQQVPNKYMRDVTYSEAPPTVTSLPHPAHTPAKGSAAPAASPETASGTLACSPSPSPRWPQPFEATTL
jgi:hypothetical protein